MYEIRQAKSGEAASQKEIWKLCFGDRDKYIDFYYANRYKEEETLLLLYQGKLITMLTMIPATTVMPDNQSMETVIIYAMATHPDYQKRGFATKIIKYCHEYLEANNINNTVLVPQHNSLFNFYQQYGYQETFYIQETSWTAEAVLEMLDELKGGPPSSCTIKPCDSVEYNLRRNELLQGRLYIAYQDEDISYQKKLSQFSGADIYLVDGDGIQGCAVIERTPSGNILIKELLIPDFHRPNVLRAIVEQFNVRELMVRTPSFTEELYGDKIRPFGMIREHPLSQRKLTSETKGYMGLAFD